MTKGNIHSIETCGTVDGPGIRYVLFLEGCLLRCQFCHNPDTWGIGTGNEVTVEEIVEDIKRYKPFFKNNGGLTVTGGEPLLQIDFLIELFKACKNIGVHTTIDSSGGCYHKSPVFLEKLEELFKVTDLVMLDLKHIDKEKHKNLTGKSNEHILEFAQLLSEKKIPVWIRHVLVPTITNNEEDLKALREFINTLSNVEKVEILPYHRLGVYKWKALGLEYPLEHIKEPTQEEIQIAKSILL